MTLWNGELNTLSGASMIDIGDIEAARERIAGWVRRTPVTPLVQLQSPVPTSARVSLKLECLQVTGSFKARGAMNRFLGGPQGETAPGIVTASGGNHGLAVARTAFAAKVPATIFVPSNVSPAKVVKMQAWKARVEVAGDEWSQSNEAALAFAARTGAVYFHPFADPLVVAGQGTLRLRILEDLPGIDAILVAHGGGSPIARPAAAPKARRAVRRLSRNDPHGPPP